mmetsp:Transcript_20635/g.52381  ORF Transcript_20635/g.52381 Transcript_20635/m.52381 type:complete len:267 (-) Transcript_20635:1104-1904(-)
MRDHSPTASTRAPPLVAVVLLPYVGFESAMQEASFSRGAHAICCSPSVEEARSNTSSGGDESATTTSVPSAAATEMARPTGGRQMSRERGPSQRTRQTQWVHTCTSRSPVRFAQSSVLELASKPGRAASSSSSPERDSTRVSSRKERMSRESWTASEDGRSAHRPLMPASSTDACSSMPMPFRITRRLPSLYAPEQHTTCPCPDFSGSTTQKSWIGPRFGKVSTTSNSSSTTALSPPLRSVSSIDEEPAPFAAESGPLSRSRCESP